MLEYPRKFAFIRDSAIPRKMSGIWLSSRSTCMAVQLLGLAESMADVLKTLPLLDLGNKHLHLGRLPGAPGLLTPLVLSQ